jgi:undecaprenyl-diphosphatase
MHWWHIAILAVIQGAAELWPISSSAHVIVAERLLGLDPGAPEMTFLLVMLHTGTMGAVLVYFWPQWRRLLATEARGAFLRQVCLATACTGGLGLTLTLVLEWLVLAQLPGHPPAEVEQLFRHLPVMSAALLAVGFLILRASRRDVPPPGQPLTGRRALLIGVVQGLCLPFRGFSRSGATISTALLCGITRREAESFSFALAVVLTPPVIGRELWRLWKAHALATMGGMPGTMGVNSVLPGLLGMLCSAGAGLVASWHYRPCWSAGGGSILGITVCWPPTPWGWGTSWASCRPGRWWLRPGAHLSSALT